MLSDSLFTFFLAILPAALIAGAITFALLLICDAFVRRDLDRQHPNTKPPRLPRR